MKNHYRMFSKSFFGIALFISLFAVPTKAQLGDVGEFLKAGADDATILTREYLKPFPTGFGTGLNAGFTEGAAAKKNIRI